MSCMESEARLAILGMPGEDVRRPRFMRDELERRREESASVMGSVARVAAVVLAVCLSATLGL